MRKVIFIGGTSYSGSTLLDMILANDRRGFSCGEVNALFNPYRPHHVTPRCGCGVETCGIWQAVLKNGERRLFQSLFERFSQLDFIVDSSKDPFWIKRQLGYLAEQSIDASNILIWKTPVELAHSFLKRNRLQQFEKSFVGYHRLYMTLIENWRSIKYHDLAHDHGCLKMLCDHLAIDYFDDKYAYWQKQHHTLFGNNSAKIHLYARDHRRHQESKRELAGKAATASARIEDDFRTIYYQHASPEARTFVRDRRAANRLYSNLESILAHNDLISDKPQSPTAQVGLAEIKFSQLSRLTRQVKARLVNRCFESWGQR